MDSKTILGIVASLVLLGVSGGLALYRDVGVLRESVEVLTKQHFEDVSQLRSDLALRDLRERNMRDALIRLEEQHRALAARSGGGS